MIEDSAVPVVAVLQGLVTGPGAELALAARARLADPRRLRLAFADVTLGLCPAGGTTRRLPQLIGAKVRLRLLTIGKAVPASEALALGLIDGLASAPGRGGGAAGRGAGGGGHPATARARRRGLAGGCGRARADPAPRGPAAARIVDCVEAALLLPRENAQEFETRGARRP